MDERDNKHEFGITDPRRITPQTVWREETERRGKQKQKEKDAGKIVFLIILAISAVAYCLT